MSATRLAKASETEPASVRVRLSALLTQDGFDWTCLSPLITVGPPLVIDAAGRCSCRWSRGQGLVGGVGR